MEVVSRLEYLMGIVEAVHDRAMGRPYDAELCNLRATEFMGRRFAGCYETLRIRMATRARFVFAYQSEYRGYFHATQPL